MSNIEKIREAAEKEENLKISKKINSLDNFLSRVNVTREDIVKLYVDSYFRGTKVSKEELFRRLLTITLTREDRKFLTECGNKVNTRQKDRRTALEYAVDLIIGWFEEDTLRACLLSHNIPSLLNGADSKREFLTQKELNTDPDLIIGNRLVEVVFDRSKHWTTYGKADLRDNKFNKLVEENALLVGIDPTLGMGFLINVSDRTHGFEYSPFSAYNKPVFTSNKILNYIKPFNEVIDELCKIFQEKESIVL